MFYVRSTSQSETLLNSIIFCFNWLYIIYLFILLCCLDVYIYKLISNSRKFRSRQLEEEQLKTIIFLFGNNLKINTQRSSLLRQLGCVFDNLNQCVLRVKMCGSRIPRLSTLFWCGLQLKIDCKQGIEFCNRIEMQMESVFFVMMR